MTSEWISAAKALKMLCTAWDEHLAKQMLVRRAAAEMVKARAARLIVNDDIKKDQELPSIFWEQENLSSVDWEIGDFQAHIGLRDPLRAYDVQFDRSTVLDLIPLEDRGSALATVSIASNPLYVTARKALEILSSGSEYDQLAAQRALIDYAQIGHVRGSALQMQMSLRGFKAPWQDEQCDWEIPTWFWEKCTSRDASSQDWITGVFRGKCFQPLSSSYYQLTGVHFVRSSLTILLPSEADSGREIPANESDQPNERSLSPLSDAELQKWWRAKEPIADSLSEEELLTLLKAKFPRHFISRARIREFTNGRKQGPKPIRHKNLAK